MTVALASILALVAIVAAASALLSQLWIAGRDEQSGVGPWANSKPKKPSVKLPPEYASLRLGEKYGFSRLATEWPLLTERLNKIETDLGGTPKDRSTPSSFSKEWLELRLQDIENIAGPMPGKREHFKPLPPVHRDESGQP